jgi:hypothetical protein
MTFEAPLPDERRPCRTRGALAGRHAARARRTPAGGGEGVSGGLSGAHAPA